MMNYLMRDAQLIRSKLGDDITPPDDSDLLFLIYAVLMRAKGAAVSLSDVHDAWSAWMATQDPKHPSIAPFDDLSSSVQSEDLPYVMAIHRAYQSSLDQKDDIQRSVNQQEFVQRVREDLQIRGLAPRTLGVTDYDIDAPLKSVRRLMLESCGLMTIAFRRINVRDGVGNFRTDLSGMASYEMKDTWLTTPWAHIEPAMAYQLGLPILILREKGVRADGILEKGVAGIYLPEFDVDSPSEDYLGSHEWRQLLSKWEMQVKSVADRRGDPPRLY